MSAHPLDLARPDIRALRHHRASRFAGSSDLFGFEPNFTIIDAPSFKADPARDGTRSETVILVNLTRQLDEKRGW